MYAATLCQLPWEQSNGTISENYKESSSSYHLLPSTVCVECHMIKQNMFSVATDAEHGFIFHVSKYQSGLLTVVENGSVTNAKSCKLLKELSDRNVSCKKSASLRHQIFQVCHLKPFLSFSFSSENFFCCHESVTENFHTSPTPNKRVYGR